MISALVILPTYNEAETLESVVLRIKKSEPLLEILIVDDNSPDGTGEIAKRLAESDQQIHYIKRERKEGLGKAYVAAFEWALERQYEVVVEHDADGSHQPEQIHRLLNSVRKGSDLVVGSRWIRGGSTPGWPIGRVLISKLGSFFARKLLRSKLTDMTSGFRALRTETLKKIDISSVISTGYGFQVETAWLVESSGAQVREVPITFVKRQGGESKMNIGIILEAFLNVIKIRFRKF